VAERNRTKMQMQVDFVEALTVSWAPKEMQKGLRKIALVAWELLVAVDRMMVAVCWVWKLTGACQIPRMPSNLALMVLLVVQATCWV